MIVIIDYGVGNLASVRNMLCQAGGDVCISQNPAEILKADKLLLPGVGHFDYGMQMLNKSGLRDAIEFSVLELKRPVLGICLGAQILGKGSDEGESSGLGWIDMYCHRLEVAPDIRVPHMGWNNIICKKPSPLFNGLKQDARFYFVHSYRMQCENPSDVLAVTTHGQEFTAAVQHGNIYGTQFHPEKSLSDGLSLMKSFVDL